MRLISFKILILFIVFHTQIIYSQQHIQPNFSKSYSDTQGELTVTNMGSANYKIPIALPPTIKEIAPQISLTYNSSSDNGIGGYGWSITGLSSISLVSSRLDLEGYNKGITLSVEDKLSLDGQRLILKSGKQGREGSLYETENYSNLKIEAIGSTTYPGVEGERIEYFKVTFPNGVQVYYGSSSDARGLTEWLIKKWIDPQGNYIEYTYSHYNNTVYIKDIIWGLNEQINSSFYNKIHFTYKERIRKEQAYVQGIKIINEYILDKIEVYSQDILFRKYQLEHEQIEGNYQRLISVKEYNGKGQEANPLEFSYYNTPHTLSQNYSYAKDDVLYDLKEMKFSSDFDGDGRVDVLVSSPNNKSHKVYFNIFQNLGIKNSVQPLNILGEVLDMPIGTDQNTSSLLSYRDISPVGVSTTDIRYKKENILNLDIIKYQESSKKFATQYIKKIPYPHLNESHFYCQPSIIGGNTVYKNNIEKKFITGDFNGDGISELIVIGKEYNSNDTPRYSNNNDGFIEIPICETETYTNYAPEYYVDLNPNILDKDSYKVLNSRNFSHAFTNLVIDFDGDGKSDILSFSNSTKTQFTISSLNKDRNFDIIFRGEISEYDGKKPLLIGELNGDGKTDLMIAEKEGSANWFIYLSTGKGFEKIRYDNFRQYQPAWRGAPSANRERYKRYRLEDLNKDGKSDFIETEYETWTVKPGDRDGRGYIRYYENLGGAEYPKFGTQKESVVRSEYGYEDPIMLIVADYSKNQRTGNYVFVQGNEIWRGDFAKDFRKDILLKEVKEAGTHLVSHIKYADLESGNGIYSSSNKESYPYREITRIPNMDVVSSISVYSPNNIELTQYYKYHGLTVHTRGLGILGFKKIARSNRQSNQSIPQSKIWSVEEMYPQLGKEANSLSPWISSYVIKSPNINLSEKFSEDLMLSKKSSRFKTLIYPTQVISLELVEETTKNYLTGVSTHNKYTYDPYHYIKESTSTNGESTIQKNYTYIHNPSATGKDYYLGRLVKQHTKVLAYGDEYNTEQNYQYTNNLLTKSSKKGDKTETLNEDLNYDIYGNITTKTLSGKGVSPRTTKSLYDSTGRFIIEKTSTLGLKEYRNYNTLGQLIQQITPLGEIIENQYDSWGKLIQTVSRGRADSLVITRYQYERTPTGGRVVTTSDNLGGYSRVESDVFSREIKTTTKGFSPNTYISKNIEYDALGRKIKESEPYFNNLSPTLWNHIEYDELDRPLKKMMASGKIITYKYQGLSITTRDGLKVKTIIKDAQDNTIRLLDNGEELTYKYYAHGGLKSTHYKGHTVTLTYDGWGNKTSLLDPTVSNIPYTYAYNLYGELVEEHSPKGVTQYTYDAVGKVVTKEITGEHTQIKTKYKYSSLGFLLEENGISNQNTYQYTYTYDHYYRLASTKEISIGGSFEKIFSYDSYGRNLREIRRVESLKRQRSEVSIETHYNTYNGFQDQLIDVKSGKLLWALEKMNERMQIISARLGNGIAINNNIDVYGYMKEINHQGEVSNPLFITYNFDIQKGTLKDRNNNYYNWKEEFSYDSFDRLTHWTDPRGTFNNNYETDGRIKENSQVGIYNYQNTTRYKKSSIDLNAEGVRHYISKFKQQITYNTYKNPVDIIEGNIKIHFDYNPHNSRSRSQIFDSETLIKTKYYSSETDIEIIETPKETKIIHYLLGSPYESPIIYLSSYQPSEEKGEHAYYYLHRDYQGSILAISNSKAKLIERRVFTPWGEVAKVTSTEGEIQTEQIQFSFLDRGYTGHEHFFEVGLIHMNGRMYDPVLKQFLSPDNNIQETYNSQNYNRYAYVLNNPLLYTDPSGEFFITGSLLSATAITAAVAGVTYTAYALYTDTFSWKGLAQSVVLGAGNAVTTYGVGQLVGLIKLGSNFATSLVQQSIRAAVSGVLPTSGAAVIPIGDWSISFLPYISGGSGAGLGIMGNIGYDDGNFSGSIGFGLISYSDYKGLHTSGIESRLSGLIGYRGKDFGVNIGTNFWKGFGEIGEFNQRTAILGISSGDFKIQYENDGSPFSYLGNLLNNNTDMYRTAAIGVGIKDFYLQTNLFTGPSGSDQSGLSFNDAKIDPTLVNLETNMWKNSLANKYRLGVLSINYKGFNIGVNSEHIRNIVQNKFAHTLISPQPGFEILDRSWKPYVHYQQSNMFTLW